VKFRLWHWSGGRLRPGAWATALELTSFLSPDRQIWCSFSSTTGFDETVYCGHQADPVRSAQLKDDGSFIPCDGVGCVQNWDDKARVLKVGQAAEQRNLTCLAAQASVTCTVIGGKTAGKGFRFDAAGATAVG
jgi:hypothetical protein